MSPERTIKDKSRGLATRFAVKTHVHMRVIGQNGANAGNNRIMRRANFMNGFSGLNASYPLTCASAGRDFSVETCGQLHCDVNQSILLLIVAEIFFRSLKRIAFNKVRKVARILEISID